MQKLDVAELRSKIDMNGLYVDFAILRSALSVANVARDWGVQLSEPTFDGECRGTCPKCKKEKSFTVNINTNRFNCFGNGCKLKGGGVIDFFSRLNEVSAKDSSHLLACAYGIQPYSSERVLEQNGKPNPQQNGNVTENESAPVGRGVVTRSEFDDLKARFERLSNIVWLHMLQNDAPGGIADEYDPPLTKHHVTSSSEVQTNVGG
ncbi:MAG: CHC2 zinc finger domain-containing protein [Pyrinomonadaceae bacterium]